METVSSSAQVGQDSQATQVNAPDDLRPGDILLYKPSDLVGAIIAIKTWCWLSHVECYLGGCRCLAARIQGVNIYSERIDKYLVAVRRPKVEMFNTTAAYQAIQNMIGKPYEVAAFWEFFDPLVHRYHASRICSSVATAWLRGGGCEPFNPEFEDADASPAQLWQTPALETIWEARHAR
jgi:uncharacterized protein YycO